MKFKLKKKKEGEEAEEGEVEEEPESENEGEAPVGDGEEVVKKQYVRFTEKDYTARKPLPNYDMLKSVETLCISAGNSKPNLKSYVLCAGILYGNGEEVFYNLFRRAWLQNPLQL